MNPSQIELVRESFALVVPRAVQAGALFYDKLFERDPSIGMLFHTDMATQARRLFEMIGDAVRLLDAPEHLDAMLAALGARHLAYGVRDEHYETVGGALLDTLSGALGEAFTPELREAWGSFYGRVSRVMLEGAHCQARALRAVPPTERQAA
ncbi:MAG: globin family protein [Roseateles sp.]|uniref:globin family protein n=1 Tax=Roseateles sp. TaxID=1971397 RepID=UPI0039EAC9B2